MQVNDVMTKNPACCAPETPARDAARMMMNNDCGAIPVVENLQSLKLVGIVTDRDIALRVVAQAKNAATTPVRDCMSTPVVSVTLETGLEECADLMEKNQIRRIPVVDASGACCGVVTQAHVARNVAKDKVGEVVKGVSQKTGSPSRVSAASK